MPIKQRDLFQPDVAPDLFGAEYESPVYRPEPDRVRARLQNLLAEVRGADRMPWEPTHLSLYRHIFPQMSLSLPEEEAAQLRIEFETELARLEVT